MFYIGISRIKDMVYSFSKKTYCTEKEIECNNPSKKLAYLQILSGNLFQKIFVGLTFIGLSLCIRDLCLMMSLNLINLHVLADCPLVSQRLRNDY